MISTSPVTILTEKITGLREKGGTYLLIKT